MKMNTSNNAAACGVGASFLDALRSATKALHAELDTMPLSVSLMSKGVNITDYTTYLQRFEPVIAFTEAEIFPMVAAIVTDLDERRKHHFIKNDLMFLSAPMNSDLIAATSPVSTARAMGFMYVMEGSTLGGAVIHRHLVASGVVPAAACRFFTGYGAATGEKWKRFLNILCEYVAIHHCADEVIAGAVEAFQAVGLQMKSAA